MDENTVVNKLKELVSIPTISSPKDFVKNAEKIGWKYSFEETFNLAKNYFVDWLGNFSSDIEQEEVLISGEYRLNNILAFFEGESEEAILLEGHYDVVNSDGSFTPLIDRGKVYGRGTADMKGGLVAAISALETLLSEGKSLSNNVYLLLTCEEEVAARGIFSLAEKDEIPSWIQGVGFCVCLEPSYMRDWLGITTEHPGIACIKPSLRLENVSSGPFQYHLRIDVGARGQKHSSAEPSTLDPNFALLMILKEIGDYSLSRIRSDRGISGAANKTSLYTECEISTSLREREMRELIHRVAEDCISGAEDHTVRRYLRERGTKGELITLGEIKSGNSFYDFSPYEEALLNLKGMVSKYINPRYSRAPMTIAVLSVEEGIAQAKIDIRTDSALRSDLEKLLDQLIPFEVKILWNDPGLEQNEVKDNKFWKRFLASCEGVVDWREVPRVGWTEASVLKGFFNIPCIIAGPGQIYGVAHTREEFISIDELTKTKRILERFITV